MSSLAVVNASPMRLKAPFLHFTALINVFDFESSQEGDDDDENVTIQEKAAKKITAEHSISSMNLL